MKGIIILILFLAIGVSAQVVIVKDLDNGKPLELVSVYSTDLNRSLITNSKGIVNIKELNGSAKIIFKLIGYERLELSFSEISNLNNIVKLKPQAISLENVLVSAKRWDEDKSEIPHTIEVITPKDIELQNPQTAADMLSQSGNVYVQKSQLGGGSPMIRGFATNRVLIVVDKVRMNNAIFRSGNLQNVIALDANSLANSQIIFGPGSVIYGSDAIGGVMEFNTLSPQFSFSDSPLINGSALTRYSSANNEKTGHLDFAVGFEKWGFLSSLTYSEFGDLKMGSNGPDDYLRTFYQEQINNRDTFFVNSNPEIQKNSGYNQINFMQKIRFKPTDQWEFDYGLHYSTTSDIPRYDRLIELRNNSPRSAEWYYGPQKWFMNNLTINNFTKNLFYDLSQIVFAYQNFKESRNDRSYKSDKLRSRRENVDAISINTDFVKSINTYSQIFYGAEAVFNKVGSTGEVKNISSGAISPESSRYPNGSTWNSYGAYVTYKNKFSDQYILQTGIRYNLVNIKADFDTTFFPLPFTKTELNTSAFTGSAGLVWHPKRNWQINFNLATGFRSPNIDDIGKVFDSEPGSVVIPNPNLKSEYVYSAELGIMKVISNQLKIELVGFYAYLDNALVRRDFSLNGRDSIFYDGTFSKVEAIQNAAFAYNWGLQFGIDYQIINDFKFISKANYQKGEEEDDFGNKVPLRHTAPWYGTTRLIYSYQNYTLILYADYNGEISHDQLAPSEREKTAIYALDENGNPYSPAWFTLNFKAGVKLGNDFIINVSVENIFDKRYRTYSSGISAPGRNFITSLKYNF